MANNSFITELLAGLGQAIKSLTGWTQATHQEAQAARQAAERGGGGGGGKGGGWFDVIEGLPGGSGNAKSLTAMLSGMKQPMPSPRLKMPFNTTGAGRGTATPTVESVVEQTAPTTPRTSTPSILPNGRIPPWKSEIPSEVNINIESIARMVGRMVGGIFRKLTGTGTTAVGSGAVGAAGQTGMTGGLLVRGATAAMGGIGGAAAGTVGVVTGTLSVGKALGAFASRINEQSRDLRAYSGQHQVAFAALDRQKGMLQQQHGQATAKSLTAATAAEGESSKSWQTFRNDMRNAWNWMSTGASKVSGGIGNAYTATRNAIVGPSKNDELREREKMEERGRRERMSPEERQKYDEKKAAEKEESRKQGRSQMSTAFEKMINARPGDVAKPLQMHQPGQPMPGNLTAQMGSNMFGINPPRVGAFANIAPAAFGDDALKQSGAMQRPLPQGPWNVPGHRELRQKMTKDEFQKQQQERREEFAKKHPGLMDQIALEKRMDNDRNEFNQKQMRKAEHKRKAEHPELAILDPPKDAKERRIRHEGEMQENRKRIEQQNLDRHRWWRADVEKDLDDKRDRPTLLKPGEAH